MIRMWEDAVPSGRRAGQGNDLAAEVNMSRGVDEVDKEGVCQLLGAQHLLKGRPLRREKDIRGEERGGRGRGGEGRGVEDGGGKREGGGGRHLALPRGFPLAAACSALPGTCISDMAELFIVIPLAWVETPSARQPRHL